MVNAITVSVQLVAALYAPLSINFIGIATGARSSAEGRPGSIVITFYTILKYGALGSVELVPGLVTLELMLFVLMA